MNCHEIDTLLNEHAARALKPAERSDVDLHLANCERCADAWFVHEALLNEPQRGTRPGLLGETTARVLASAALPAAPQAKRRFGPAFGLAAAAALVAAVLVSLQWPGGDMGSAALPDTGAATAQRTPSDAGEARNARVSPFLAGQHYDRVPVPVPTASDPGRIEVCEFFMFWCVHCYALEPELERWAATKPDYVDLVRVPAIFNATARLQAQAFYAAEALGRLEELRTPFYEEIHVRGNALDTEASIKAFFGRVGVDSQTFRSAFDSPAVYAKLRRAEQLNRAYGVSVTPSITVNGKYLTTASMAGSYETLFTVVDDLIQSELDATCQEQAPTRCPVAERLRLERAPEL